MHIAQVYLYYYRSPRTGWSGWLCGPDPGAGRGGLILESASACVERDIARPWRFYDGRDFVEDGSVTVTCFHTDTDHDPYGGGGHTGNENVPLPHVLPAQFLSLTPV